MSDKCLIRCLLLSGLNAFLDAWTIGRHRHHVLVMFWEWFLLAAKFFFNLPQLLVSLAVPNKAGDWINWGFLHVALKTFHSNFRDTSKGSASALGHN